jgi:hypothetical protein
MLFLVLLDYMIAKLELSFANMGCSVVAFLA